MNKLKFWHLAAVGMILVVGSSAHARKFSNQFIEFDLPPRWECGLEGSEWICQSTDSSRAHEAIMVLAAKHRGNQDSLDQYRTYLEQTKTFTLPGGKTITSEPRYSRYQRINEHAWVDSLHLSSEIPGFYTRYLATVKDDIAILVTYSIAQDKYQDYQGEFDVLVDSLRARRGEGGLDRRSSQQSLFANIQSGTGANPTAPPQLSQYDDPSRPAGDPTGQQTAQDTGGFDFFWLLIIAGIIGYVIIRKRRKG